MEGEVTGDLDLDADAGALLVRPTHIVEAHPVDRAALEAAAARARASEDTSS
jgi:hypothetical protein